jgi:DNA-binding SARP family transcriptional activator
LGSERLLAFVALHRSGVRRMLAAGTLWPDVPERRALASLRSALSRLDDIGQGALCVGPVALSLAEGVDVDLHRARQLAHRLLASGSAPGEADLSATAIASLSLDLLPGWYEDWVLLEAESWRELRLHALEAVAGRLKVVGRFGEAAVAACAAARAEPLRESGHAALICVYLAEGNQSEALREFSRYEQLLGEELGLRPTEGLRGLVAGLLPQSRN